MKRDGRTLDHATLETIRLMAVERVLEGEVASAVITSYGFNRTTIYKWLTAAAKPGVGLRALQARPAPGRPRRLRVGSRGSIALDRMAGIGAFEPSGGLPLGACSCPQPELARSSPRTRLKRKAAVLWHVHTSSLLTRRYRPAPPSPASTSSGGFAGSSIAISARRS